MRDYRKEFRGLLNQAKDIANGNDPLNTVSHISFTAYGKKVLLEEIRRYRKDADLDYELEILSEEEYWHERLIVTIMLNCIKKGEIY